MSAEVLVRRQTASHTSLPRPSSLYLPDVSELNRGIVSTSSYSPYPTFNGTTLDPHGLDQFLLPPDDKSLFYINPSPAAQDVDQSGRPSMSRSSSSMSTTSNASSSSSNTLSRKPSLMKHRSLSMLRRPSPLSQPPVSGKGQEVEQKATEPIRARRRSTSVDSGSRSPVLENQELQPQSKAVAPPISDMSDFGPTSKKMNRNTASSKSIKRAFTFTKRSFLGMPKAMTPATSLTTPSISSNSGEDSSGPATPLSSRSNSNFSEASSSSSTSSGSTEEIKTPSETPLTHPIALEVEVAGGKLAEALARTEDSKNSGKSSWRGWLAGKRLSKMYSANSPGNTTPPESRSGNSSPKTISVKMSNGDVPRLTLTPSPSIVAGTAPSISRSSTSSERTFAESRAVEQMRRSSLHKLNQLRAPSPHPHALSLRRQYSNLPEEIASSIQSGQKVFPLSVNVVEKQFPTNLNPDEGGLRISMNIKRVLSRLESGEIPPSHALPRLDPPRAALIVPRPRGMLNFVSRPPYEERNLVFYPNGSVSPISMARPGYGVWDLDFSAYIQALSRNDDFESNGWPIIPRPSIASQIDELDGGLSSEGSSRSTKSTKSTGSPLVTPEDEVLELLPSPETQATTSDEIDTSAVDTITLGEAIVEHEEGSAPISSFRNAGKIATWDYSSEEEAIKEEKEDEEEDDDEEEAPLNQIKYRRSFTTLTGPSAKGNKVFKARSKSQPARHHEKERDALRSAHRREYSQTGSKLGIDLTRQVVQARERRSANLSGEAERKAESERQRNLRQRDLMDQAQFLLPSSSTSPRIRRSRLPINNSISSSTSSSSLSKPPSVQVHPASPPIEIPSSNGTRPKHTRSQSYYDSLPHRPTNSRNRSDPTAHSQTSGSTGSSIKGKRYHSFYDAPAATAGYTCVQAQAIGLTPGGYPQPVPQVMYLHGSLPRHSMMFNGLQPNGQYAQFGQFGQFGMMSGSNSMASLTVPGQTSRSCPSSPRRRPRVA